MERTRTSVILSTSFSPIPGGIERYMHLLSDVLGAMGPVSVLTRRADGDAAFDAACPHAIRRFDRDAGRRLSLPVALSTLRSWTAAQAGAGGVSWRTWGTLALNRSIARDAAAHVAGGFDVPPGAVLHAARALPEGVLAQLVRERMGNPSIVYAHGAELFRGTANRRQARLLVRSLRSATRVAAVSAFTERRVSELGVPPERIVRLPPAIDAAPFLTEPDVAALRHRLGIGKGPVLLTHGRLDERKGHDVVLEALPALLASEPELTYVVSGAGPHEPVLRRLVEKRDLARSVVFTGRMESEDLPALYRAADVFVMLSRRIGPNVEGFGIVCLEAAASARPVVVGRSGGTADAVEHGVTGLLVEPTNVPAVVAALSRLLANPDTRADMGRRGRERVLRDFDRDSFRRRVERLVDDVSGDSGHANGR